MSESITLPNGKVVKLGRIRPKARPNALRLAPYLKGATPPPPSVDYSVKAMASISQMYLNDQYGDCVIAGKGHAVGVWTANESGTAIVGTDTEIYNDYETICGRGDNGCDISAVLDYMKATGLTLAGKQYKIDGYVSVDWTNQVEVQTALYIFGTLTIGINLPNAWAQSPDNGIWDVTNTRIVGGHDVTCVGYNATGVVIATWGSLRTITWAAFTSKQWIDECYAMLSPDWYAADHVAPSGIDVITLTDDLAKLGAGTIPPIDPTPDPVPTPTPTPTPVPVVPTGLTLAQAQAVVASGIAAGKPFGIWDVADKASAAAVAALATSWPSGAL
jgi:hypothetical protein